MSVSRIAGKMMGRLMEITLSKRLDFSLANSLTIRAIYKVNGVVNHYCVIALLEYKEELNQSAYITQGDVSDTVTIRANKVLPVCPVFVKSEAAYKAVCQEVNHHPCVYNREEHRFFKMKKKPVIFSENPSLSTPFLARTKV